MNKPPVQILLADDHHLVRRGLKLLLESEPRFSVVAEAGDGYQAVELAIRPAPRIDLAVLDIAMPRMTGIQAAAEITRIQPHIRVLMLSMYDHDQYLLEAHHARAAGYVSKSAADQDLLTACRQVLAGGPFVHPDDITEATRAGLRSGSSHRPVLTGRERQILKLTAEGHPNDEIAGLLHLSVRTVERHRSNIMKKLEMRDRTELTRYAIRTGLVEA